MRLLALIALLSGCAHRGGLPMPGPLGSLGQDVGWEDEDAGLARREPSPPAPEPSRRQARREARKAEHDASGGTAVAKAASSWVGSSRTVVNGETYRADCSGFVEAAYARAGLCFAGSSEDLYNRARDEDVLHKRREPTPGDVAFFDDTWDKNGNGRRDDPLSHVAIVESVGEDGTIVLIHRGSKGITRIRMNLRHPDVERSDEGVVYNDGLRSGRDDGGDRLTGELFRAFGSLWAIPNAQPTETVATR